MNDYFDIRLDCNGIDFCYSRRPDMDEREIHTYHEILYYIDGDAELICKSFRYTLKPKTLLMIPKESYHFFHLTNPERFERLKISFSDIDGFEALVGETMGEIRIIEAPYANSASIFDAICKALVEGRGDRRTQAFAYGSLLVFLSELTRDLGKTSEIVKPNATESKRMLTRLLRYIEENLSKPLNTDELARQMNISSSSLSHIFKNEMGISLHKYIVQKRLILASKLLDSGGNPSKIFRDCGYRDYSSFYKAYLKMFGAPPSQAKK